MSQSVMTRPKNATPAEALTTWSEAGDLVNLKAIEPETLPDLRERFIRSGYVHLKGFLAKPALKLMKAEMDRLSKDAVRRDFDMPGYLTPRHLSVLGGSSIRTQSPILHSLYGHVLLKASIESIVGRAVHPCTHPEEFMVANYLHRKGDTHGWHLDDPAYALVVLTQTPAEGEGGEVEIIPNWTDLCRRKARNPAEEIRPMVTWARKHGLVDRHQHQSGDAYILRADRNLHRVTPLRGNESARAVVNLAYQSSSDTRYGGTANRLYKSPRSPA